MATAEHDLLNGLIATYRELNTRVRSLPEERLTMAQGGKPSVRQVVTRMRDNEMEFSQALKEAISGIPIPEEIVKGQSAVIGTESESDTTSVILSQFGTARESTLAMLRSMTSEDWNATAPGGASIRTRIQEHMARNKQSMEDIVGLLGSP